MVASDDLPLLCAQVLNTDALHPRSLGQIDLCTINTHHLNESTANINHSNGRLHLLDCDPFSPYHRFIA